jgi:hypothetical protein
MRPGKVLSLYHPQTQTANHIPRQTRPIIEPFPRTALGVTMCARENKEGRDRDPWN